MNLSEFDYQILSLSDTFYADYPNDKYGEIESKENRPYNCLLIQSSYDYYICVPYRSNVRHGNAYHFKKSKRSKQNQSALDYSKIVIINKSEYLSEPANIDNDEYVETISNINHIAGQAFKYVQEYVQYIIGKKNINSDSFKRKYRFTTLKYFHDILL